MIKSDIENPTSNQVRDRTGELNLTEEYRKNRKDMIQLAIRESDKEVDRLKEALANVSSAEEARTIAERLAIVPISRQILASSLLNIDR